jgi:hypothetical protein
MNENSYENRQGKIMLGIIDAYTTDSIFNQ